MKNWTLQTCIGLKASSNPKSELHTGSFQGTCVKGGEKGVAGNDAIVAQYLCNSSIMLLRNSCAIVARGEFRIFSRIPGSRGLLSSTPGLRNHKLRVHRIARSESCDRDRSRKNSDLAILCNVYNLELHPPESDRCAIGKPEICYRLIAWRLDTEKELFLQELLRSKCLRSVATADRASNLQHDRGVH